MKTQLVIIFILLTSICSADPSNKIQYEKLEELVVNQSGEMVSESFEIDINSDGKKDKLLGVLCGNAGCQYFIFIKKDKNLYSPKGDVFLHSKGFEILQSNHNGINDLLAHIRLNVSEGSLVRYEHDGTTYKTKARLDSTSGKEAFELIHPSYKK